MRSLIESAGPLGWGAAFLAGMISFLSPCVLPLVPGYLSMMSGLSADEMAEAKAADLRRVLRSTLLFVGGFTVVFVALGASATALGDLLTEHQLGFNRAAGVLVIVMGLFMAGVVSPRILQRERRLHVAPSQLGGWAPPVMGMAFAFGWTPCIGPALTVIFTLAANQDTVYRGVLLLLFYSLGLGVPFVASGLALNRLTGTFAFVKRHFRALNLISGAILVTFGLLLLTNQLGQISIWIIEVMDDAGLDFLTSS